MVILLISFVILFINGCEGKVQLRIKKIGCKSSICNWRFMDEGSNNDIETVVKYNFLPYGKDFNGGMPTGRFFNGKMPPDLIGNCYTFYFYCYIYRVLRDTLRIVTCKMDTSGFICLLLIIVFFMASSFLLRLNAFLQPRFY